MTNYLLTISCQQKTNYIKKEDLDRILEYLYNRIPNLVVKQRVYETSGHYGQLHFHGIVEVPRGFRYKGFTQYGDIDMMDLTYRIQWSRVTSPRGAIDYITKDLAFQTQSQILAINEFKYKYFDQDTQELLYLA